jgi:serine phosphatase RsbU (regulator of sigma subunit)/anti-sigma regulatory factor (Ser/Thr protein kinase)/transposase
MFRRVIKEECKVPADIKYLGEMRNFVTHVGRKYGVPERVLNSFKLAIDEGGTNIIRHAYRDWDGFITLRMVIRNKDVTVSLIDQGHTFDLRQVRDPDLQRYVDIGKKGGLGIFIIRRVVDAIDYRKTVEGNELKLIKNIPSFFTKKYLKLPGMGLPLKARYSVYASIFWTLVIAVSGTVSDSRLRNRMLKTDLASGRSLAKTLAHQCIDPLAREETIETARIVAGFQRDHSPVVLDALVVDSSGVIQGSIRPELILEAYRTPEHITRIEQSIERYRSENGNEVYDIVESIVPQVTGVRIGQVHLLLDKKISDRKIAAARSQNLRIFLIVLFLGYGGIFGLIFLIMSPLKRLVRWINAAGQGEIQDDVEFDASDEIGEIAHAFNEITEKFRKSQENLAEQERLQKEMQVAQEIQHTLLPSSFPKIEGYELSSYYEAAREVGGDYFDFVEVDKESLGIVVADVSGKGVPGSLIMTMIRTALRTEARGNKNAADVLARVNEFVINDMKRGMFVTVFYIILDSHNRTINYASAGHNPMILYRGQTNKSYYLNPRGFPIGLNLPDKTLFRKSIESDTIYLKESDVLIVYTDGITEAMNAQREKFGEERFLSIIRKCGRMKVDPLVDHIRDEIKAFTGGEAQSDDITLVAVREQMKAEDVLFNLRSNLMRMVNEEQVSVKEACQKLGVSTSTYYKYKRRFDKMGLDGLREQTVRSEVEEKHIAIEDKVKLLDIIKNHPDFGPKKIVDELNSEKYGFTIIDEKRVYDELVKSRLNTRDLRQAFAQRGERGKRTKPPGTPFLTLDGQIILDAGRRREIRPISWTPKPADLKVQTPTIEIRVTQKKKEEEEEEKKPVNLPVDSQSRETTSGMEGFPVVKPEEEKETGPEMEQKEETSAEDMFDLIGLQEGGEKPGHVFGELQHEQTEGPKTEPVLPDEGEQAEDLIANSVGGELFEDEFQSLSESSETPEPASGMGIFEKINGSVFESDTVVASRGSKDESRIAAMLREMNRRRHMDSGQWFYRQGLYAKAVEEFRKVIDEKPDSWEAYQHLGDSWYRLGQLDKAMEAYEKVKLLNPSNVAVLENLGVIFANRGDYKKAVWQWGEVLKKNPQRTDIVDRIKRMQKLIRQHTT